MDEARQQFNAGKYEACILAAAEIMDKRSYAESWPVLKIRAELTLGRYADARKTLRQALDHHRHRYSVRLRWWGNRVYQHNNQPDAAREILQEIDVLLKEIGWPYRDPESQVVIGKYLLERAFDPKQVLDNVYNQIKKRHPDSLPVVMAIGALALEKHDFDLAVEVFVEAKKLDELDPEVHLGLARAYSSSDPTQSGRHLEHALELNPHHIDSLLLVADRHIDAERYEEANEVLTRILAINGEHPRAWAYRAVLAHLDHEPELETQYRERGLKTWPQNPEVDHWIGFKLSQKYRFSEGAKYQRQSLALAANFIPARLQLSHDLLRLGDETEGWQLAHEVFAKDAYSVVAYNLTTLHDHLQKFHTLEADGFVVRMETREAQIYGHRVLDLLKRAKQVLGPKYDVTVRMPVFVEIFPDQQDFAIRTFGLPGGAGFLGVCFGSVITANSPAALPDTPSNWMATLWHEFCHVVTLQKTENRMPRWLSEGISVYEERQADPAWGQSMTPEYREMILGKDLVPVSQLSGAFLNPPSPVHLQFAYYESSLVVEYLVDRNGIDTLKKILDDLRDGLDVQDALQRNAGSLAKLDHEFAAYARQRAQLFAPNVDWEAPDRAPESNPGEWAQWVEDHPRSFRGLQRYAKHLLANEEWESAQATLKTLIELYPDDHGPDNAYAMLARTHRELGDESAERAVLETLSQLDASSPDVYLRLMKLASSEQDWSATIHQAERMMGVNPLVAAPHRYLAQAAEATDNDAQSISAHQALLILGPIDPAETHYRLATRLRGQGDLERARRHILLALEEAPRFREAQRELLAIIREISDNDGGHKPDPTDPSNETRNKP